MTGAELKRFLRKHRCKFLRHGGRHDQWINPANGKMFMVSCHDVQEMKSGTVDAILKEAGLK